MSSEQSHCLSCLMLSRLVSFHQYFFLDGRKDINVQGNAKTDTLFYCYCVTLLVIRY